MTARFEYILKLSPLPQGCAAAGESALHIRTLQPADAPILAELMIDAYRNTIDYDGETLDDALAEINAFLAGERGGPPRLGASFLAFDGDQPVGACLTGGWQARRCPVIAYVMTAAA